MFNLDRKSIAIKLTIIMLVVILLQSILSIGSVFISGSVQSVKTDAYNSFQQTVDNRKNYLNNEMIYRWSNINGFTSEIKKLYNDIGLTKLENDQAKKDEFLKKTTPVLISMIRATMSTGTFVILDDNKGENTPHSCIYLKDYDPVLNNDENKDLYMLKGPNNVSRDYQIPLDSSWNYGMTLEGNQKNMFDIPYKAAKEGISEAQLGYWNVSKSMATNTTEVLTYTFPLLDSAGEPFGVIGVEISQDYLFKHLPKEEISDSTLSEYILGFYDDKDGDVIPKMIQGSVYAPIASLGEPLNLKPIPYTEGIYKTICKDFEYDVISYPSEIKLYNEDSYFASQHFVLLGMADNSNLMYFADKFIDTIMLSAAISIFVGALIVFLAAINFVKPILTLANEVRLNDPHNIISFSKTGLSEIDELSSAIEALNSNILEKSLKTDKIISMTNLPLGTFEYNKNDEYVKCSTTVIQMMSLEDFANENNQVEHISFFNRLKEIKSKPEADKKDIYILTENPIRYIQIVSIDNDNSILGVVMDVTREILEQYAIKFERDYDTLTGIYNRSAFKREVLKIFQEGVQGTAAFIIFDLDNLKYINDTYGHETGDRYIREIATVLTKFFEDNGVVGRMSGDEFFVFVHSRNEKDEIYECIRDFYNYLDLNLMLLPNGDNFKMRVSGGLAWYEYDSKNFEELSRFADFAMYEGKHTVKGETREFNKDNYESGSFILSGSEELNKVLDNQLVEYVFQPIIDAQNGDIYAYESLMRPQSDILSTPLKLIQMATSQSRLWQVEKITFFKTLSMYKKYEDMFDGCKIFINSVPNEKLKESEYKMLERSYGDVLDKVVIEIIESEKLASNILDYKKNLVKSWGGAIALDDYGAGYNGDISMLSISPEIVKIDKVLIDGIDVDKNRQSIVHKLMLYTKEQNILTLAEGVETKSQMEYLLSIGIDLLQGFYIAKPAYKPNFDNKKISEEIIKFRSKNETGN